ncbi:MAG: helicase-associated domain-containing protein [Anaerolineales bacterium]|nr:helicase-associated domain-containing protein [Anaerolineales bacterium]
MPTLLQSLQKHDLGHLQIMADGWDIALSAPDVRQGRKELASAVIKSAGILVELVEDLDQKSQDALSTLIGAGGQVPWHLFVEDYGPVREIGPGRRDREKPYLSPISTTEKLWYLGLISRDFFDSDAGPQEFAYIPEDLMDLMPDFLRIDISPPLLSRIAAPMERACPFPVDDHILDHATTFLAAARASGGQDPDRYLTVEQSWPMRPDTLAALLKSAGLIDEDGLPLAEPVRAFLEAPRPEALASLADAWLHSPDFDDLAYIPHIAPAGEWRHNPMEMRQSAISMIRMLPEDQWWSLPALISTMRAQQPDFLRPKGDYDSWYLKDRRTGQYLRGIEFWDQVEGAYLEFLITGPLHWLGFVELAAPQIDGPRSVFRFSPWWHDLWDGHAPDYTWHEDETPKMDSQGQILVPRQAPRAARYLIARFCEWRPPKGGMYSYQITPASLTLADQQGLKVRHLIGLLQRYSSSPLPPHTLKALSDWETHGTQASFQKAVVLRVSHPKVLEALQSSPGKRFLGTPLGPTTITVAPGALQKVQEILISLGYLSEDKTGEQ